MTSSIKLVLETPRYLIDQRKHSRTGVIFKLTPLVFLGLTLITIYLFICLLSPISSRIDTDRY